MNIVLEGPDGGGKSTLATLLSEITGMPVAPGEGPPKAPGEIVARIFRLQELDGVIFDRHPIVSESIYGPIIRGKNAERLPRNQVRDFYDGRNFIIYCQAPINGYKRMTVGKDEDPDFIAQVEAQYADIRRMYEAWALERANYVYRISDGTERLTTLLGSTSEKLRVLGRRDRKFTDLTVPGTDGAESAMLRKAVAGTLVASS